MAIPLPATTSTTIDALTPRQIVAELDKHVIGQAKGLIMATEGIVEDAAFDRLRVESQRQNIKLRDVAEQVVRGRSTSGTEQ